MRLAGLIGGAGVLALAAVSPALAAEGAPGPTFNIMGPSSCGAWPKAGSITSASRAVPLNWALGYLSGVAMQTNMALLGLIDPEALAAWLTTYCQANPAASLPGAVRVFEAELEAKLPRPEPPPQPPMFVPSAPAKAVEAPAPKAKPRPPVRRKKPAAKAK